jgi:peptide/nickel transport system permease protein
MRVALEESGKLALGLLGALVLALAISALSVPGAAHSPRAFALAALARLLAFLRLDFGTSRITDLPAVDMLASHVPVTATLIALGALVSVALGAPLGLLFGSGGLRRVAAPIVQIVSAAPVFVAGLAVAYAANRFLGWPPGAGPFPGPGELLHPDAQALRRVVLPALTVGFAGTAAIHVALRRAAAGEQDQPYRESLRRLGLSALEIDRVYVAPVILAGLFSSLGEVVVAFIASAVVSEWVFRCPGAADLFVKSVALGDWNMAGLILFLFCALSLVIAFIGRLLGGAILRAESQA